MSATTVSEVMHRDVPLVDADMPYKDIIRNLAAWHAEAVVVLDASGSIAGIVSASDLIARPAGPQRRRAPSFAARRARVRDRKADAGTAAALMSRPVVHVPPEAPLTEAARVAADAGVHELVVLDASGRILGLVDRADLLVDYLRSDEEIRGDIVDGVLVHEFRTDPAAVDVTVRAGVVTLTGCVESRQVATLLVAAVRAVTGVVDVVSRLGDNRPD